MGIHHGSSVLPRSLDNAKALEQVSDFVRASGYRPDALALVKQIHGTAVQEVWTDPLDTYLVGTADALITDVPGITLVIRTADCVPLVFIDPIQQVVAVAHAGWKGIANGIIDCVVERMRLVYGCQMADLKVKIGPAICGRHYDVSTVTDDRVQRFEAQFSPEHAVVLRDTGQVRLDLPQACLLQCVRMGIPLAHIERSAVCTYEDVAFPSHRREGEARTQQIWTWVCLDRA